MDFVQRQFSLIAVLYYSWRNSHKAKLRRERTNTRKIRKLQTKNTWKLGNK